MACGIGLHHARERRVTVEARHIDVQEHDIECVRLAPRQRLGAGIRVFDVEMENGTRQHLAHDFQRDGRVVDQQHMHRGRDAPMRREDCLDLVFTERLGQELIGVELARKIDAAPV